MNLERAISAAMMFALLIGASGCRHPWKTSLQKDGARSGLLGVRLISKSETRPIRQASQTQHEDEITELHNAQSEQRQRSGPWPQWLNRLSKPKRIPLPRTDLQMEEPHETASDSGEPHSGF